jgi:hypothetical protein
MRGVVSSKLRLYAENGYRLRFLGTAGKLLRLAPRSLRAARGRPDLSASLEFKHVAADHPTSCAQERGFGVVKNAKWKDIALGPGLSGKARVNCDHMHAGC